MLTGGCLCGAVRYEVEGEPTMAGHCHCLDCQKATGAGHSSMAFFLEAAVRVTGRLSDYSSRADSGALVTRSFCPTCGSWLIARSSNMPGGMTVCVGTLDEPDALPMQMRVYDKRRRGWDAVDPSLPAFEAMPPMMDTAAATA